MGLEMWHSGLSTSIGLFIFGAILWSIKIERKLDFKMFVGLFISIPNIMVHLCVNNL